MSRADGIVLALSGGIGGAKLALGLSRVVPPDRLIVVANTGDDFEHLGLSISPDLDTLMYTLAELSDPDKGWGRRAETWTFIDGDKTIPVHPQGRFKADNGMALAAAAVAGLGIAALPEFLTEKELASGGLVALMNSYPLTEIGIYIVRSPGHHPARKVRVLTELLIEHLG